MGPSLIEATLADVADPLDHVMVAVVQFRFKHFQIAHLQARAGKRDLGGGSRGGGGGGGGNREEEETRRRR